MNKKLLLFIVLWLGLLSSYVNAESKVDFQLQQQSLTKQMNEMLAAEQADQLFLEDVLRRKNDAYRKQIKEAVNHDADEEQIKPAIEGQMLFLEKLLSYSQKQLSSITKQTRKADAENLSTLQFLAQKRITIMQDYYADVSTTLSWGETIGIDFSQEKQELVAELTKKADFFYNTILFMENNQTDLKKRISFADEELKGKLNEELNAVNQRFNLMVSSLSSITTLMEQYKVDTTEYKKLLFSVTGNISSDVLDVDVLLGLTKGWMGYIEEWLVHNGPSLLFQFLVFIGILWIAYIIASIARHAIRRSVSHSKMNFSKLMQDFFVSMGSKIVFFIGVLIALSQIGIELAPLLTGFGVAGLIVGFALQDTLSNFASGMMILIYRPYDVGDMVEVSGITGKVSHMNLVSTTIKTIDNQQLVIPNNKIWGDVIKNITAETVRRVDMVFGIGYQDDIDKAKTLLHELLEEHPMVLKSPEPMVKLHTLNESSVDFVVRPWVKTDDYWEVYWDITELVKKRFDEQNITIPFPQRDVHLYAVQNHDD